MPIPIKMTGFHLQNSTSHLTVPTCNCTFIHNICFMQSCTLQFIHELQTTYNYQYVLFLHRLLLKLGHRFIRGSAIALTLQLFTLNYYCLTSVHLLSLLLSYFSESSYYAKDSLCLFECPKTAVVHSDLGTASVMLLQSVMLNKGGSCQKKKKMLHLMVPYYPRQKPCG